MTDSEVERGADLHSVLRVVLRRSPIVLVAIIVAGGLTYWFSSRQEERYTAETSVLLRAPSVDEELFGAPVAAPEAPPERQIGTNVELLLSEAIKERARTRLLEAGRPAGAEAVDTVEVTVEGESDLALVTAESTSPEIAAITANTYVAAYRGYRRQVARERLATLRESLSRQMRRLEEDRSEALRDIRRADTARERGEARREAAALRRRINNIDARMTDVTILAGVQTSGAEVVEAATPPEEPSSPKTMRNTLIGGFAGLLIGLALALLRQQSDRRLVASSDLEEFYGVPVLANIPKSSALGDGKMPRDLPLVDGEAFRMLRANLRYFNQDREIRTVLVTSPRKADGKSTVCFHLAAVTASTGARVLLLEADVRKPALGRLLNLPADEGLTDYLVGAARSLEDIVNEVPVASPTSGDPRTLDVVLAGLTSVHASELLDSPRMRTLLEQARDRYDLVVIDTPPAPVVSDAIPLLTWVDAVIAVNSLGTLTAEEAGRLRKLLAQAKAPLVGIVANFTRGADSDYYGSGYEVPKASNNGHSRDPVVLR